MFTKKESFELKTMKAKDNLQCVVSFRIDQACMKFLDQVCTNAKLSKSEYLREKIKDGSLETISRYSIYRQAKQEHLK